MNFVEDLDWVGFESGTSASFTVPLEPPFRVSAPLAMVFFTFGFDFSEGRGPSSSFAFPSRFFFEGSACRSFKNAETSAVRFGYLNNLGDEKRSSR